jgi:hypothetical protein
LPGLNSATTCPEDRVPDIRAKSGSIFLGGGHFAEYLRNAHKPAISGIRPVVCPPKLDLRFKIHDRYRGRWNHFPYIAPDEKHVWSKQSAAKRLSPEFSSVRRPLTGGEA